MSTRTDTDEYLVRLRHELADLPPSEVDEIVEDLEPQLTAIADELGADLSMATLVARLGTPAEYARELRGAMGEVVTHRPSLWRPRVLVWTLVASTVAAGYGGFLNARIGSSDAQYVLPFFVLLAAVGSALVRHRPTVNEVAALPEVRLLSSLPTRTERTRQVFAYLTSLRPAWFLVRAVLAGLGVMWMFRRMGWWDAWPEFMGIGAAVVAMVASYRALADRGWLWISLPITGWAIGVSITLIDLLPRVLSGNFYYSW